MSTASSATIWVEKDGEKTLFYDPLEHQARFHASIARYCLMEGGRGSGKSKAIRCDAYIRCLAIPRFRALIVRRSMPELKQSHLNDVPFELEKLGFPRSAWHATDFVIRFPNGSTLRFGHVEDDSTLAKYLSSEYEAIYFDELATFTLRQFRFLCSSLRSPIPNYMPIARGGTNPVGPGASWVKAYFIDKQPPADDTDEDSEPYNPEDYEAIHSTMEDNPHIDRDAYRRVLGAMPSKALRKALLHGEWVVEGQFFSEWSEIKDGKPWHVIDTLPGYLGRPIVVAPHIEIVRVIDWGYAEMGNPGVCLWFVCLEDGSAIGFKEYVFRQTLPADAAREIKRRSEGLRIRYTVGDTAMWQEHEGPSIAEHFENAGVPMIEADKQREAGWVNVHNWLRETVQTGVAEYPRLRFLRSGCPLTIRTLPQMVVDPKNPADMETRGVEDDCADDVRYFVQSRPQRSRQLPRESGMRALLAQLQGRKPETGLDRWAPAVLR